MKGNIIQARITLYVLLLFYTAFTQACEASQPSSARVTGTLFGCIHTGARKRGRARNTQIMKGWILPSNKRMVKMSSNRAPNEELLVQLHVGIRVVYHFGGTFPSRYHRETNR